MCLSEENKICEFKANRFFVCVEADQDLDPSRSRSTTLLPIVYIIKVINFYWVLFIIFIVFAVYFVKKNYNPEKKVSITNFSLAEKVVNIQIGQSRILG